MSGLKRKNLQAMSDASAAMLPSMMSLFSAGSDVFQLELDKLSPAPADWNFYKPLSDNKMIELIASIEENGLLHPIVVWQRGPSDTPLPGETQERFQEYVVLSGHNRLSAFRRLYEQTGDAKYARIGCSVRTGLTEQQAREIIIDSNWVQRNLTISERTRSIYQKYVLAGRKQRAANGAEHIRTYDIIAREYNLSGRQIHRYIKLNALTSDLLALVDEGKLSFNSGVLLADYPSDFQAELFADYRPLLTNKNLQPLKPGMKPETVKAVLCGRAEEIRDFKHTANVTVSVPIELKDEFIEMSHRWLSEQREKLRAKP